MIYATYSLVILALILCSAFFSLAEMSFLLASPVTLRHWAEDEDNRSAAVALGMLDDANRVLTTINIGDTIDIEGFLYWYEGAQPHVTSVTVE